MAPLTPMSDHDLLITLNENVGYMRTDLASMRTQIGGQISDHEARIRVAEADLERIHGAVSASRGMILIVGAVLTVIQILEFWFIGTHK